MKLAVHAGLFSRTNLEGTLDFVKKLGVNNITVACGGYESKELLDPSLLLKSRVKFFKFRESLNTYDVSLSALSCIGNPISSDKDLADAHDKDIRSALAVAELLECDTLIVGSGKASPLGEGEDEEEAIRGLSVFLPKLFG